MRINTFPTRLSPVHLSTAHVDSGQTPQCHVEKRFVMLTTSEICTCARLFPILASSRRYPQPSPVHVGALDGPFEWSQAQGVLSSESVRCIRPIPARHPEAPPDQRPS